MKIKRKIGYSLLLILGLLNCNAQEKYTINGIVNGGDGHKAFLTVTSYDDTVDTLAKVDIKGGVFTIKGHVDEVTSAYLAVEGMLGAMLLLENGCVYNVTFQPREMPMDEGGGRDQQLRREFIAITMKSNIKLSEMSPRVAKAFTSHDTLEIRKIREEQALIMNEIEKEKTAFLKRHGNTFFALQDLARRALGMNADDVKTAFDLCDDKLKATAPGRYIAALLPKLAKIAVGATVPDFVSTTPEGKEVSLYSIRPKIKLIDFWSSNCGRCRRENRLTVPIYEKYHDRGFDVISYSLDTKRDLWLRAIAEDRLPWTQVSDLGGQKMKMVTQNYGIWSLPANLLVDENNKVIARNITSEDLEILLPKLLNVQ